MPAHIVIACPTCSQKYRVDDSRLGHHAICKKCHQRFRIQKDQPIDDETILGWVMEDGGPDQSVLGSTSIFRPTTGPKVRPTVEEWQPPEPPEKPRVKLDRIDDIGAYFEFPIRELEHTGIRQSFPHKCIHCLKESPLQVHLIIWGDKLPRKDTFHRRELETKALGRLDQMLRQHQNRWFDLIEPMSVLPPPYCNPFPYFVCQDCSTVGEVTAHVLNREGEEFGQIAIANLDVALEFCRNNGGERTSGFRRLADAAQRQRDDRWRRLSFPVRARISAWFKLNDGERFLGYFADSDFSRAETGNAGVVLTDNRLIYKKYSTKREYDVETGGKLAIEANAKIASIRISQMGTRDAMLQSSPLAASHLAKAINRLKKPWKIDVHTKSQATS
jgi:hypothetical protein